MVIRWPTSLVETVDGNQWNMLTACIQRCKSWWWSIQNVQANICNIVLYESLNYSHLLMCVPWSRICSSWSPMTAQCGAAALGPPMFWQEPECKGAFWCFCMIYLIYYFTLFQLLAVFLHWDISVVRLSTKDLCLLIYTVYIRSFASMFQM